jgi:hypothetical protein
MSRGALSCIKSDELQGANSMTSPGNNRLAELERRELQLTIFACFAIAILAIGTAVLMYPVVFPAQGTADPTTRIAFFGFCALCLLLAWYVFERQRTIRKMRLEMAEERKRALDAEAQANRELLKTMPKLNAFQDSLPMEFRRTAATTQKLSILVVTMNMKSGLSDLAFAASALSDGAKAVSRRLREQDSMYILGPACIGAVLPGADTDIAQALSAKIAEGLNVAAANSGRNCSYAIKIVNYPTDASSAHELQHAVQSMIPGDDSMRTFAEEALI